MVVQWRAVTLLNNAYAFSHPNVVIGLAVGSDIRLVTVTGRKRTRCCAPTELAKSDIVSSQISRV